MAAHAGALLHVNKSLWNLTGVWCILSISGHIYVAAPSLHTMIKMLSFCFAVFSQWKQIICCLVSFSHMCQLSFKSTLVEQDTTNATNFHCFSHWRILLHRPELHRKEWQVQVPSSGVWKHDSPVGSKYKCLLINFINQLCIYKYIHNLTILIWNIGIYKIALGKTKILYTTTWYKLVNYIGR